jgi:hypothetical protein
MQDKFVMVMKQSVIPRTFKQDHGRLHRQQIAELEKGKTGDEDRPRSPMMAYLKVWADAIFNRLLATRIGEAGN